MRYGIKPRAFMGPRREVLASVASLPASIPIPPAFPGEAAACAEEKGHTWGKEYSSSWDMESTAQRKGVAWRKAWPCSHTNGCLPMPCSGATPTGFSEHTAEPKLIWEYEAWGNTHPFMAIAGL